MNRKELSCSRLSQIVVVGIQLITSRISTSFLLDQKQPIAYIKTNTKFGSTSTTNFINLYCYSRFGPNVNSLAHMFSSGLDILPAPRIKLVILEVLYHCMACIHKHLVEVPACWLFSLRQTYLSVWCVLM